MKQEIRLAAILARQGRILLARDSARGWELPGGPMQEDEEDVDLGMAAYLREYGVRVAEIEETFLQTAYLPMPGGQVVLNLYAPDVWEGEPIAPRGEARWHLVDELAGLDMEAALRQAVLSAFGLAEDPTEARIAATFAAGAATEPRAAGVAGVANRHGHGADAPERASSPRPAAPCRYDIFIASRWRNGEAVDDLARRLREKGLDVYCFRDADDPLTQAARGLSPEAFMQAFEARDWRTDPGIRIVFEQDIEALRSSAALVMLLPAGKSSHMEAGIAFGLGKRCILIGEAAEAESLYLLFAESYPTVDAFLESRA